MSDDDSGQAGAYSRASRVLGWLITLLYAAQTALTVRLPRVEKTSVLREDLRSWHYLIGLTLFALLIARLWQWLRDGPVAPAPGMSAAAHRWGRSLGLAAYLVLVCMPVFGINQAWTEGLTVRLGPLVSLPALVPENRLGWMFAGYFHSALGFAAMLLTLATVTTGAYLFLRRGVGLLRAFPPGFGVQAWVALLVTVYAFTTFRSPEPGPPAVASVLALTGAIGLAGAWLNRRRVLVSIDLAQPGPAARIAAAAGALLLVVGGAYGPYAMFRVTPWPVGEVVSAPEGVTSHAGPIVTVEMAPETDFERQVRQETYKWCRFCHTVGPGEPHLAGPNLYAIFGQQAATVPNFYYSRAMAEAGRDGLRWTDDTLDRYLAGPDAFVPGTSMIISSGPVRTPEERAAIINILKRETMTAPAAAR